MRSCKTCRWYIHIPYTLAGRFDYWPACFKELAHFPDDGAYCRDYERAPGSDDE